jgi:hypothetical protein
VSMMLLLAKGLAAPLLPLGRHGKVFGRKKS